MTRENAASSPGGRLTGICSVMDARTVGQMHSTAVAILGRTALGWAFDATVPTPHGPIRVTRDGPEAPIQYELPNEISIDGALPQQVSVRRRK